MKFCIHFSNFPTILTSLKLSSNVTTRIMAQRVKTQKTSINARISHDVCIQLCTLHTFFILKHWVNRLQVLKFCLSVMQINGTMSKNK